MPWYPHRSWEINIRCPLHQACSFSPVVPLYMQCVQIHVWVRCKDFSRFILLVVLWMAMPNLSNNFIYKSHWLLFLFTLICWGFEHESCSLLSQHWCDLHAWPLYKCTCLFLSAMFLQEAWSWWENTLRHAMGCCVSEPEYKWHIVPPLNFYFIF